MTCGPLGHNFFQLKSTTLRDPLTCAADVLDASEGDTVSQDRTSNALLPAKAEETVENNYRRVPRIAAFESAFSRTADPDRSIFLDRADFVSVTPDLAPGSDVAELKSFNLSILFGQKIELGRREKEKVLAFGEIR